LLAVASDFALRTDAIPLDRLELADRPDTGVTTALNFAFDQPERVLQAVRKEAQSFREVALLIDLSREAEAFALLASLPEGELERTGDLDLMFALYASASGLYGVDAPEAARLRASLLQAENESVRFHLAHLDLRRDRVEQAWALLGDVPAVFTMGAGWDWAFNRYFEAAAPRARVWWEMLEITEPGLSPPQRFRKVSHLMTAREPWEQVGPLVEFTRAVAAQKPPHQQDTWQAALAHLFLDYGRLNDAVAAGQEWMSGGSVKQGALFLGDATLQRGDADAAATLYGRIHYLCLHQLLGRGFPFAPRPLLVNLQHFRTQQALALLKAGRPLEAALGAERAVRLLPHQIDATIALTPAFEAAGMKEESTALYRMSWEDLDRAKRTFPNSATLLNNHAWLASRCCLDLDQALADANRAVELEPESTAFLDTLAEVHFQRGSIGPAIEWIRRALLIDPHDPYLQEQLERFETRRRERAKGLRRG
jgi:tetratricopeptide (TPR) repeat protein